MRLILIIFIAWLSGWFAYSASLFLIHQESPFTHDVGIMGYWSLIFGLPFCLAIITPVFLLLQVFLKKHTGRVMFSVVAMTLSVTYISLILGSPFKSPEVMLMLIFAITSSLVFGILYPWTIVEPRAGWKEWLKALVIITITAISLGYISKLLEPEIKQLVIEMPSGFRGNLCVDHNIAECPPIPLENGKLILRFPENGYLCTSSDVINGPQNHEFFFIEDGKRTPMPYVVNRGISGSGSGGYETKSGETRHYEFTDWHISTSEELKEFYNPDIKVRPVAHETCDKKIKRIDEENRK